MRLRIDDDHLGLTGAELLLHAKSRVEPDVPGTDHKNPLRSHDDNDPLVKDETRTQKGDL
ncbi:hypothetical protein Asi02nite_50060 [Asanoa siamensis]|uniref:Uncharacterized protein n=1 Tax=Asanoa siamensis TaxID=926357 RepID=A0ABQ4CWV1_9ACTN|nr:hypothetical protein Asi02nite_50060 [Asanoa siamensis]